MDRDGAELRFRVVEDFGDTYIEAAGYDVPVSEEWPDGVNYRLQYGARESGPETAWDDGTILRYDNKAHPDAPHHHKHTIDGEIIEVDFDGLESHFDRFRQEVINHGERD